MYFINGIYLVAIILVERNRATGELQITGAWRSGRGPGAPLRCICFVCIGSISICPLYKLNFSGPAQIAVRLKVSLFDLVSRLLACPPLLWEGLGGAKIFSSMPEPALCGPGYSGLRSNGNLLYFRTVHVATLTLLKINSCTLCKIHSHSHLTLQTVKNVCETHNYKPCMFRSQLSDHPQGSSFVLVLLLIFQPACFVYLLHDQTSHRQVHQTHVHIDNIQPHTR
jgi:hypothetical protein